MTPYTGLTNLAKIVAGDVLGTRPLTEIPAMKQIAETTVQAQAYARPG